MTNGDVKYPPSYGKNGVYTNGVHNRNEEDEEDEEFFLDTIEVNLSLFLRFMSREF